MILCKSIFVHFGNMMLLPFRRIEDYAIIGIGPGLFKICRLLSIVLLAVHFLACLFWRVKLDTAGPEAVAEFLSMRGIPANVRRTNYAAGNRLIPNAERTNLTSFLI